jgi:hypothetical protein
VSSPALLKVASGERLIVYGILLCIASPILNLAIGGSASGAAFVAGTAVEVFGLSRVGSGMGYPIRWRLFLAVCFFIPLIGLIVLLIVTSQGFKALRAGGMKVDLLGVWRQTIRSWGSK